MKYIDSRYSLFAAFLFLLLGAFTQEGMAQQLVNVKGVVMDESSQDKLIGVGILSQAGDSKPVTVGITDVSGKFSVRVANGSTLIFRYIGYADYTLKVSGPKDNVHVRMGVNENKLKEALVIGYQKRTKELTTGSTFTITHDEIQDIPVSNAEQLLQGRVAGLNIQNNTGSPGARGFATIRGLSNIKVTGSGNDAFLTPTSPLYVIDGVPVEPDANFEYGYQSAGPGVSPLSLIPVEDIEKIEVLKDAQATGLYGSRGAYGVILVTTVRGSSPVPLVRYRANFFVNTPPKLRSVIGGNLERRIRVKDIRQNGTWEDIFKISKTPFLADSLNPFYNNSTNWQSIFYQATFNQTHNINISGGDPSFNYKANLGYYHEVGIIKNTGFDRYSLGTNMTYQPNPKLKVFTTFNTNLGKRNLGSGSSLLQKGVSDNGKASSLLPGPSFFQRTAEYLSAIGTENDNKTLNIRVSADIRYQLITGLTLSSTISYDYESNTQDRFTPAAAHNDFSQIYTYDDRKYSLYNRNSLVYFHSFNKNHNFNLTLTNEIYNRGFQAQVIRQEKTPNDQYQGPLGYDAYFSRGGGLLDNYSRTHTASFSGFFSYNFKKKYVLNASYRMDGSSSSGFEDPYSKNPTLGFRYNFSYEDFFKSLKWLTYGSIRGTWGKNIVPTGDLFAIYGTYYPRGTYNGNPRIGIDFDLLPNPYLKPQTTTQYDLGLEAGLFDSRVEVIFDVYYKEVKNMLREKPLSNITGFNDINSNETSLVDYGYELTLTFRPISPTSAVQWTLSVNGALNKDILTHLPNNARQLITWDDGDNGHGQNVLYRVGRNALTNYLYKTLGVYQTTQDVPVDPASGLRYRSDRGEFFEGGDPIWKDKDGNYILNADDLVAVGNSQPLITGGIQSYLNYKNFSFNVSASYLADRDILNNALAERLQYFGFPFDANAMVDFSTSEYWTRPGQKATYPNPFDYTRYSLVDPYRYNQTLFQEDGSYFKINSVTLAYMVEENIARQLGLRKLRFYVSCLNPIIFSPYSGPNPENVSALGRDQSGGYPIPTRWNAGVNLDF